MVSMHQCLPLLWWQRNRLSRHRCEKYLFYCRCSVCGVWNNTVLMTVASQEGMEGLLAVRCQTIPIDPRLSQRVSPDLEVEGRAKGPFKSRPKHTISIECEGPFPNSVYQPNLANTDNLFCLFCDVFDILQGPAVQLSACCLSKNRLCRSGNLGFRL